MWKWGFPQDGNIFLQMFGRRSNVRLLRGHWVCGMGALEQSPESKCRTCRLHKTGRPIIARICSSIENNKIWWLGDNTIFIQIFKCWRIWKSFGISLMPTQHPPESCCQSNLKLTWNFANIKKKSFPPSAVWCKCCSPKNGSKKWIYADQWSSNVYTK